MEPSIFSKNFEQYQTEFFNKPWTRISTYLIGVFFGCQYFSYKSSDSNADKLVIQAFDGIKSSNAFTILTEIIGFFLMFSMTTFGKTIAASEKSGGMTILYLVTSRPVYTLGFSLVMLPMLLRNELVVPF
jgi:hypothetical protein